MNRTVHNRLSKLEASSAPDEDCRRVLIVPKDGETPEEASERHYAEHPDKRHPNPVRVAGRPVMNRALSTRVRTLERKAGVTDLSRLSDADLDARMRDLSARLLGLQAGIGQSVRRPPHGHPPGDPGGWVRDTERREPDRDNRGALPEKQFRS